MQRQRDRELRRQRQIERMIKQREEDAVALRMLQQEIDERDDVLKKMRAERLGIPLQNTKKQVVVQSAENEPAIKLLRDESVELIEDQYGLKDT